jgi:hypothetical protein
MDDLIIKIGSFLTLIIDNYVIHNFSSLELDLVKYFHQFTMQNGI